VKELNSTITSPNYPNNYTENLTCIWRITVPQKYRIYLKFKEFETQACCDCVEVFDGNLDKDNWNSLGKFCGSIKPHSLISTYNNMTIKFTSDKSINHKGFVAEYEVEDQSEFNTFLKIKYIWKELVF
jgi:hypothetical protein